MTTLQSVRAFFSEVLETLVPILLSFLVLLVISGIMVWLVFAGILLIRGEPTAPAKPTLPACTCYCPAPMPAEDPHVP